ncbi:MAG: aminoglycoside phosphotransferase family protein [Microcella sp.]|uniref:phosphotransferase family protein n=1 Tax=Microcella sp. TaxID=1913979 RepID=UPI003315A164
MSTTARPLPHHDVLTAVASSLGSTLGEVTALQVEPTGQGFTHGYRVSLTDAEGKTADHTVFVETSPPDTTRPGVLTLTQPGTGERVDVWVYPADPALPALRTAVYAEAAGVVLGRLGLPVDDLKVSLAAYRPGKRAVVRVDTSGTAYFLKVVRPSTAEPLQRKHTQWRQHGVPVPTVLGWSEEGLVALEALAGAELISVLDRATDQRALLDELERLVVQIASVPSEAPARASLVRRLDWYEERLLDQLPDHDARIERTARAIGARYRAGGEPPPSRTVHGDLHLAQLLVDPSEPSSVTGVLDIDTSGWGDPADDAAALYAHLIATVVHDGGTAATVRARRSSSLADGWRRRWFGSRDSGFADRAHAIAGTQLLGHALARSAAGSEDAQLLLERAERVVTADERPLTTSVW